MKIDKVIAVFAIVSGGAANFIGAALMVMYIKGGIIDRWGESDQSLLFWYLPVLFIGLLVFAAGTGLFVWGYTKIQKKP